MIDFGDILTVGIFATAVPTFMGILIAYSIIATIFGVLLWPAKSVPDDIAIVVFGSGLATGFLLILAIILLNVVIG